MLKYFKQKIKYYKENDSIEFFNEAIIISFWNDWIQWLPSKKHKWNWKNFHFARVVYEDDIMCGGREIEFVILGLGFRLRWKHETEQSKLPKMKSDLEDMLKKSFHAWAAKGSVEEFRKGKEKTAIFTLFKTKKMARLFKAKSPVKLFIQ